MGGISQAKIQEWLAISYTRGSSDSGIKPVFPALAGGFFTSEPPGNPKTCQNSTERIGNNSVLKSWKMRFYLTQRMSRISSRLPIFSSDVSNLQPNTTIISVVLVLVCFSFWKFISFSGMLVTL